MSGYVIVRYYQDHDPEIIAEGVPLEEAMAHCQDPQTSSSTATTPEAALRTARMGHWFDGFLPA